MVLKSLPAVVPTPTQWSKARRARELNPHAFPNSSGSRAMLTAIRPASSAASTFACMASPLARARSSCQNIPKEY
jgi:hypothetical protein